MTPHPRRLKARDVERLENTSIATPGALGGDGHAPQTTECPTTCCHITCECLADRLLDEVDNAVHVEPQARVGAHDAPAE